MTPSSRTGTVGVIVVAAGSGSRLGAERPKAFVHLDGTSLLAHAVCRALPLPGLVHLVVVAPSSHLVEARAEVAAAVTVLTAAGGDEGARGSVVPVQVVAGGADRSASVAAGLAALPPDVTVVLVHDAARALAPTSLFAAVAEAVAGGRAAVVPGIPVVDTVKEVDDEGLVVATPDRARLRAVQTPQGFDRAVLDRAHALGLEGVTDDAGLVERLGLPVHVVDGDPLAHKVTTPDDLDRVTGLLVGRP